MRHSNAHPIARSDPCDKLFTKYLLALKSTLSCSVTTERTTSDTRPPEGEINRAKNEMDHAPDAGVSCSKPLGSGDSSGHGYKGRWCRECCESRCPERKACIR